MLRLVPPGSLGEGGRPFKNLPTSGYATYPTRYDQRRRQPEQSGGTEGHNFGVGDRRGDAQRVEAGSLRGILCHHCPADCLSWHFSILAAVRLAVYAYNYYCSTFP